MAALRARHTSFTMAPPSVSVVDYFKEVTCAGSADMAFVNSAVPAVCQFFDVLSMVFSPVLVQELVPRKKGGEPVKLCFYPEAQKFAPDMVLNNWNMLLGYSHAIAHEFDKDRTLVSLVLGMRKMFMDNAMYLSLFAEDAKRMNSSPYLAVYYGVISFVLFQVSKEQASILCSGFSEYDMQMVNQLKVFYCTAPGYLDMVRRLVYEFFQRVSEVNSKYV